MADRIRVGYYLATSGFGGVELYLLNVLRELDRVRFEPVVFLSCPCSDVNQRLRHEFARLSVPVWMLDTDGFLGSAPSPAAQGPRQVERMPSRPSPAKMAVRLLVPRALREGLYFAKKIRSMTRAFRAQRLDAIHFLHGWYPSLEAQIIGSRFAGIPVRISDVQLDPKNVRLLSLTHKLLAWGAARSVTCIKALSQSVADQLLQRCRVPAKVIKVTLLSGLDLSPFLKVNGHGAAVRESLGIPYDYTVVAVPGRLVPQKGHHMLLDAISVVAEKHPNVTYLFLGDGPLRDELEDAVEQRQLCERVVFLGFRSDLPELLSSADLVVIPSLFEGGPYVVPEAMAAGKPVLSTDVGFVREILVNSEMGRIVAPGDRNELARALDQLLSAGQARLAQMGGVARQHMQGMWSPERIVADAYDLYEAVH